MSFCVRSEMGRNDGFGRQHSSKSFRRDLLWRSRHSIALSVGGHPTPLDEPIEAEDASDISNTFCSVFNTEKISWNEKFFNAREGGFIEELKIS